MDNSKHRKTRSGFVLFFVIALLSLIWPIYPLFNRIHPFVLGIPFSLFYLVLSILVCFLVLLGLYIFESRKGELE